MKELPGIRGAGISLVLILLLIAPMLRAIMMKKTTQPSSNNYGWIASTIGTIGFIDHFTYYIMYRPGHAARRPFAECRSRYRTGDRSNCHSYCHFIQTVEKAIHPDGTAFLQ